MAAIEKGVREKAAEYGITVAATAATDFDPAKEAAAVETVMASKPDILVTIPVDPIAGAADYKPALDAGTTIVFYDNPVDGWTAGNQYVDHQHRRPLPHGQGRGRPARPRRSNGTGTYGFIQLDVVFYNSNNREKGFLAEMAQKYPNMQERRLGRLHRRRHGRCGHGRHADPAPRPRRDLHLLQRRRGPRSSRRSRPPATRTSRSSPTTSTPPTT